MKYKTIVSIAGWLILTVGLYLGTLYVKMGDDAKTVPLTVIISLFICSSLFFAVFARERKEGKYSRAWMIASWCSITVCFGLSLFFSLDIIHGYTVATSKGELRTISEQFNKATIDFFDNYGRNVKDRADNYKKYMQNALGHDKKSSEWVKNKLGLKADMPNTPTAIDDFSDIYYQTFLTMMTNNSKIGTNLNGNKDYYRKRYNELSDVITSWNPFYVVYRVREINQIVDKYVNHYRKIYDDDSYKTIFEKAGPEDRKDGIAQSTVAELKSVSEADLDLATFFRTRKMGTIGVLITVLALAFLSSAFLFAIPSHEVGPNSDGDIYKKGYKL